MGQHVCVWFMQPHLRIGSGLVLSELQHRIRTAVSKAVGKKDDRSACLVIISSLLWYAQSWLAGFGGLGVAVSDPVLQVTLYLTDQL